VVKGIEQYYRTSLQRQVAVQISALAYGGFIDGARGVLFECLPDGDREAFARIAGLAEDGTVLECLEASASLATLCETVGLNDCAFEPVKPLRFACRCSPERVESLLAGHDDGGPRGDGRDEQPVQIFCHMCGKGYRVGSDRLTAILGDRKKRET
jgi:molecular chaperone Hsp33